MTPTETYSLIGGMASAIAFFVVREFLRKDKIADDLAKFKQDVGDQISALVKRFTEDIKSVADRNSNAVEKLAVAVGELSVSMADQRAMFAEKFVTSKEHDYAILDLKAFIKEGDESHAVLFQAKLENHKNDIDQKILEHTMACMRRSGKTN